MLNLIKEASEKAPMRSRSVTEALDFLTSINLYIL